MKLLNLLLLLSYASSNCLCLGAVCTNPSSLGRTRQRLPSTNANAFIEHELPLNTVLQSCSYTQGGLQFNYPTDWFANAPNVHVTIQTNSATPNPSIMYSSVITHNIAGMTTVQVFRYNTSAACSGSFCSGGTCSNAPYCQPNTPNKGPTSLVTSTCSTCQLDCSICTQISTSCLGDTCISNCSNCTGSCRGNIGQCPGICTGTSSLSSTSQYQCEGSCSSCTAGSCGVGSPAGVCNGICTTCIGTCNGITTRLTGTSPYSCFGYCNTISTPSPCIGVCTGCNSVPCDGPCGNNALCTTCTGNCYGACTSCAGTCTGDTTNTCIGTCSGSTNACNPGQCVGTSSGTLCYGTCNATNGSCNGICTPTSPTPCNGSCSQCTSQCNGQCEVCQDTCSGTGTCTNAECIQSCNTDNISVEAQDDEVIVYIYALDSGSCVSHCTNCNGECLGHTAECAASCEGESIGSVGDAQCQGTCSSCFGTCGINPATGGICNGNCSSCRGTCAGAISSPLNGPYGCKGNCNGVSSSSSCSGSCSSCTGTCDGACNNNISCASCNGECSGQCSQCIGTCTGFIPSDPSFIGTCEGLTTSCEEGECNLIPFGSGLCLGSCNVATNDCDGVSTPYFPSLPSCNGVCSQCTGQCNGQCNACDDVCTIS